MQLHQNYKKICTKELLQKFHPYVNKTMLELSCFLGIIIAMYFKDHNPPHFHVIYNEYDAEIDIKKFINFGRQTACPYFGTCGRMGGITLKMN
ncbi:MAG: DUF4160 domain-containing protein [Treponema sp.]|nr:DUF4160 domain-containing protein [Treponema sp.]